MERPLRFGTGLTGKTYAFRRFKVDAGCLVPVGRRDDVTEEFRREMDNHLQQFIADGWIKVTHEGVEPLNKFFGKDTP